MRLRFAPSPTGSLHLGNARTAVANWLEARRTGGALVLRIEDTDRSRNRPGAEARILEDLRWLGLNWDEGPDVGGPWGPYRQSERGGRYAEVVARLCERGAAYPCTCDPRALEAARDEARARGDGYRYPGTCRPAAGAAGTAPAPGAAVRLRVPDRPVEFADGLRGVLAVDGAGIGDFVVARADGTPTYQLAVVVDDHDMEVDHVIRGQDHLSNTPRQILLYEALDWRAPRFTHLPLVLGADRSRLSKRHGATSVADMRQAGILPRALVNYLALLGWEPPGDGEVLGPEELVRSWRVEDTSASNLAFDVDKLDWLNQQHLAALAPEEALRHAEPFLAAAGHVLPDAGAALAWWREIVDLLRGSVHRLAELPELLEPVFHPQPPPPGELDGSAVEALLRGLAEASRAGELLDAEGFRERARRLGRDLDLTGRDLFHPIRLALTGRDGGPELARLVPLLERGAGLQLVPPVADVAARIETLSGRP